MRRLYAEGHRIVACSRDMRGGRRRGSSRFSCALGRLANRLVRRIGGLGLTDPTHSFRLYDVALIDELGIDSKRAIHIPVELAAKALARDRSVIEIPTTWTDKSSWREQLELLISVPGLLRLCRSVNREARSAPRVPPSLPRYRVREPPDRVEPIEQSVDRRDSARTASPLIGGSWVRSPVGQFAE